MQAMIIRDITIKRYRCRWQSYNGIRNNVYRRRLIHAETLQGCKDICNDRYGSYPSLIERI